MSATFESVPPAAAASKSLWAAVGVLGVAVLAMGATLIQLQSRPQEPRTAVLSASPTAAAPALSSTPLPGSASTGAWPDDDIAPSAQNKAVAPANQAKPATKHVTQKTSRSVPAASRSSGAGAQAARSVCANCGTVASVTPIQRDGAASGGGAIAGGVLGAVVGNQVGGGNGKTVATILGAVGGGYAGNTVEKKMRKETVYQVRVRMEDGSTRTVEQASAASVGAKVTLEGNSLQPVVR